MTIALPPNPQFGAPIALSPVPEVLAFLATRRSTAAVTLCEPAPSAEELDILLRLATRTPDHGKLTPWRFVVLAGEDKDRFAARAGGPRPCRAANVREGRGQALLAQAPEGPAALAVAVISSPKPRRLDS